MVGSINERKGVELFSKVADLAAESHPNWQFHWIGSKATMGELYQSPKVTWHGWQWNPRDIVQQCDLFFLSSIDDPCPLAALEALHMGKRCVAYKKTGTAELIENLQGCSVYHEYEPRAALKALTTAATAEKNASQTISDTVGRMTNPSAFTAAVLDSIS
jgi:glycosyltransferase involved in cell wall biosynthesis